MRISINLFLFYLFVFINGTNAQNQSSKIIQKWQIEGVEREAIVVIPANAKKQKTPIIFVFHGHGGTMQNVNRTRDFEKLWPEAIVVYPQGLKTAGILTDPEGKKSGWLINDSTANNRDLKFFDIMLSSLKHTYTIDDKHIYATGHSNGGAFVYLLWAERAEVFAAFAPTAAAIAKMVILKQPKPVFHLMGERDSIVRPFVQKLSIDRIKKLNGCQVDGLKINNYITRFKGVNDNDVEIFIHDGGHIYPSNANHSIVDFFKAH